MDHNRMIRKPKDLESYVQYVYSSLLNLKDEGVVVSTNAILFGKTGVRHEIDVFYQFEKSGIVHKVAFECKYTKRKVEKSDVINFHGKIQDIGNIQGIFVSKSGYQEGARKYGNDNGIKLLGLDDLPTLNILLAKRIQSVALPDENYVGEPFWTIMEVKNGELTGNYWAQENKGLLGKQIVPFFISKNDAKEFLSSVNGRDDYVVRGIPQHTLNFILQTAKLGKGRTQFSLMLFGPEENGMWLSKVASAEDIASRFLLREKYKGVAKA